MDNLLEPRGLSGHFKKYSLIDNVTAVAAIKELAIALGKMGDVVKVHPTFCLNLFS